MLGSKCGGEVSYLQLPIEFTSRLSPLLFSGDVERRCN